ncbi:hypothetical protein FJY69_10380 [candidate division WOR-3 bacterium]|nr:hypothetical protein [candidate division WOR-3 bacterium]
MTARIACLFILAGVGIADPVFSDTIIVRRVTGEPPTIDGIIDSLEWVESNVYDLTNRSIVPPPPTLALGYYLFDDSFAYFAVACLQYSGRTNYDQFGLYVDEDRSRTWSSDSSEGNHWVEYVGNDSVVYRALLDTVPNVWRMPGQCPGCQSASSVASGHLEFEARIPLGQDKGSYAFGPGDAGGFFQYVAVAGGMQFIGWWPPELLMSQWTNPRYYGTLVLDTTCVDLAAGQRASVSPVSVFPSPARDHIRFLLSGFSLHSSPFSVLLYSSSGRLVRSLSPVCRLLSPVSSLDWDCRDADGAPVPAGTYFYRVSAPTATESGRVIVMR